jgi:prepilin-type N-terminal cleavage/methylation domain-containing protein
VSSRTDRAGFSLLEAVIALAIVGVTSIAALSAAGTELRATEQARRAVEAEALATDRLAAIRILTDEELRQMPDSIASGTFAAPFDRYRWTVESEPTLGEEGLTDISVTIEWGTGAFELRTKLYRRPPLLGVTS